MAAAEAVEAVAGRQPAGVGAVPVRAVVAVVAVVASVCVSTAHSIDFSGLTNLSRSPLYHALIRSVTLF